MSAASLSCATKSQMDAINSRRLAATASLLMAFAACTGQPGYSSSSPTPQSTTNSSGLSSPQPKAFAAWRTFPADAKPRPLVMLWNFSPQKGFSSGDGKMALLCNRFALDGYLPTDAPPFAGAAWADGTLASYRATSAAYAYQAMTSAAPAASGPQCTTVEPIVVTAAHLGTFPFETDRGLAQISAWLFAARTAGSEIAYPAVSSSDIWGGGVTAWSQLRGATVSTDGRLLTVAYNGRPPCGLSYKASVAESPTAVVVTLTGVSNSPPATSLVCPAVATGGEPVTVAIAAPLGGRVVVDPSAAVVPICPDARPPGCYYTYPAA